MSRDNIEAFAAELMAMRARGDQAAAEGYVPPIATMDDALAVQDLIERQMRADGSPSIGYKLGATNQAARDILGVSAPFRGRLFDRTTSTSGANVPRDANFQVWEVEIGLRLGEDLDPGRAPFTAADIESATAAILPAIEIVGTVFHPFNQAPALCLVADNAVHGHWVRGTEITDWSGFDVLNAPIRLLFDGAEKAVGKGANVDGGPFGATAGLANELAAVGRSLQAGDYVTTGTVTPIVPIGTEQVAEADFGSLGSVRVALV